MPYKKNIDKNIAMTKDKTDLKDTFVNKVGLNIRNGKVKV